MFEYYIWIFGLIVANILDSVTTELALNKLPEALKAKEYNPFMNALFKRRKYLLANLLKYGFCILISIACFITKDLQTLKVVVILMCWVVLNNTYILSGRWITHKKIVSPIHNLLVILKIPESWHYLGIMILLIGLTFAVAIIFNIY